MPRFTTTFAATKVYYNVVRYKEHLAFLKKASLPQLSKIKYYNLQKKEEKSTLIKQKKLKYILTLLKEEDVYV